MPEFVTVQRPIDWKIKGEIEYTAPCPLCGQGRTWKVQLWGQDGRTDTWEAHYNIDCECEVSQ